MIFFGLLHVAKDKHLGGNFKDKGQLDAINVYYNNAVLLSNSLKRHGIAFRLITNNKATVLLAKKNSDLIDVVEIPFLMDVPERIKFYSAHYKIEVFKYFSRLELDYCVLVDLDCICIGKSLLNLKKLISEKKPLAYDITNQTTCLVTPKRISDDLRLVTNRDALGQWYGGEFIGGTPKFFASLYFSIEMNLSNYFRCYSLLHHQGDEVLLSAAIQELRKSNIDVVDVGKNNIITRYWSNYVPHTQPNKRKVMDSLILHLPRDKRFLSIFLKLGLPLSSFHRFYWPYVYVIRFFSFAKSQLI